MEVPTSVTIDMLAWDVDSRDRFMLSEKEGHTRFLNLQLNNKSAHSYKVHNSCNMLPVTLHITLQISVK